MEWLSLEVVCLLAVLKTHTSCVAAMLTAKAPKTVLMNVGEGLGINKRGMIGVESCGVLKLFLLVLTLTILSTNPLEIL